jgi:hypothetical protein
MGVQNFIQTPNYLKKIVTAMFLFHFQLDQFEQQKLYFQSFSLIVCCRVLLGTLTEGEGSVQLTSSLR